MRQVVTFWNKETGKENTDSKYVIEGILALLLTQHRQVKDYNDYWLQAHDLLVEVLVENDR